jgi:hypothetical protein
MLALDIVSRELVGFIPAVMKATAAERAAKGETVRWPVVAARAAADITPAATGPDPAGEVIGNSYLTISKSRSVTFPWNGEEQRGLNNAGTYAAILRDQFAQAMRTLTNEIEADLASLYVKGSRGYGTGGTTPFATADDFSDFAQIRKILEDNGAPTGDLHLVLDSFAVANLLGKQSSLFKANEAGTTDMLRRGIIAAIEGLMIHKSGQVKAHTKSAGDNYVTNLGDVVGETTIAVDGGGATDDVAAGDVITIADEADPLNKYVVASGFENAAAGDVVIAAPGLLNATGDGKAVTKSSYKANMAFSRSAMALVTRAPALPEGGDSADDRYIVTDPMSGLSFDIGLYRQYHQVSYEVGIAWGYEAIKSEHIALLLG